VLTLLHVGHRETGSPEKSLIEFRRRLPSLGHSLSIRLIVRLRNGLNVACSKELSMASTCTVIHIRVWNLEVLMLLIPPRAKSSIKPYFARRFEKTDVPKEKRSKLKGCEDR
jgi:hypothetical protein